MKQVSNQEKGAKNNDRVFVPDAVGDHSLPLSWRVSELSQRRRGSWDQQLHFRSVPKFLEYISHFAGKRAEAVVHWSESTLTDHEVEVGSNCCFVPHQNYFKCCLCLEAKLSVRPEEQIANVLVLLQRPSPKCRSLGSRDGACRWAVGLGTFHLKPGCSAVSASKRVLIVFARLEEKEPSTK